ncbi:helix-turn-helix transcriptional regulator [Timonella sp. A28]|uniref:helix-turn-helix transcriptional regulator n=1 Tax=Timonella sp. A28 TaxID=3442640 RepID=UPI003EBF59DD
MTILTSPAERLLNLVIALMNTSGLLTRRDIQVRVAGYSVGGDPRAFERMFERDKETLRNLGVPILTVGGASSHSDEVGYRIDKDGFARAELRFSAAELGLLSLATQVWRDSALERDSGRALTKVRGLGRPAGVGFPFGDFDVRFSDAAPGFDVVLDAIARAVPVRFEYRAARTGLVEVRVVEPWLLSWSRGGWYVWGFDRGRGAQRSFRLSRVVGVVKVAGVPGEFVVPEGFDAAVVRRDRAGVVSRVAVLAVRRGCGEGLRVRGRGVDVGGVPEGFDAVEVEFVELYDFVPELVSFGSSVLVLEPADLRDAVCERVRGVFGVSCGGVG